MRNLASFRLETGLVLVQDWCTRCAKRTRGSENHFGRTRWYHEVTSLKWKLVLVLLDIVLILTQDRSTVCIERTIGSEIIFDAPKEHLGDVGHLNLASFHLETVLVSVHDRCMVCSRHTIGLEIILDALDGTTR